MDEAVGRRSNYKGTRSLLLAVGLAVLLATAGMMYVRRVETVEVLATLLFMPIFVAIVFWGVRGGVVAAILAAGAYAALRYPAIKAVGLDRFLGLIVSRGAAFVAFGTLGGWAASRLEASLEKLELYDQVDDATGLLNARFLVQDTDLETSRSKRYQTIFSLSIVDVPAAGLEELGRRQRRRVLRDLGRQLRASVRTVDRAVHAEDDTRHRFAVLLPETGPEGARVFTDRFAERVRDFLRERGAPPDGVASRVATFPDDEAGIQAIRDEFAAIDRAEHPEAAEAPAEA